MHYKTIYTTLIVAACLLPIATVMSYSSDNVARKVSSPGLVVSAKKAQSSTRVVQKLTPIVTESKADNSYNKFYTYTEKQWTQLFTETETDISKEAFEEELDRYETSFTEKQLKDLVDEIYEVQYYKDLWMNQRKWTALLRKEGVDPEFHDVVLNVYAKKGLYMSAISGRIRVLPGTCICEDHGGIEVYKQDRYYNLGQAYEKATGLLGDIILP